MIYSSQIGAALIAISFAIPLQADDLWQVIDAESSLAFELDIGGARATGGFDTWMAEIQYDPTRIEEANVQVAIDIASAHIDNLQAMSLMSSPAWFGTDAHPRATFSGSGFTESDADILAMDGKLTLKGVEEPITLVGQITIADDVALAQFQFDLIRSDFGIGDANPAVSTSIVVIANITAERVTP